MTSDEYDLLITRMNDYAEHWGGGADLKFATAVRTGMRLLIREIRRVYEGSEDDERQRADW